jgi:hypothetical protein
LANSAAAPGTPCIIAVASSSPALARCSGVMPAHFSGASSSWLRSARWHVTINCQASNAAPAVPTFSM